MSIEVRALTLHYPGVAAAAVTDVSLTVRTGELLTLLGPSGSGKSTTLRCVAGLERPTAGVISIHGEAVYDSTRGIWVKPEHRNLGMVFQSYAVWPHLTVFENIAYPLRNRRMAKAHIRTDVEAVAELVALSPYLDRSATQLSGGQQQRVALARALVAKPQAILFDEPLSNLDAKLRERMRREIRALVLKTGTTAVYVTHDQAEAFSISDRIAVMEMGHICQIGTPQDIYRKPSNAYVADFVGAANILTCQITAGVLDLPSLGLRMAVPETEGLGQFAIRPEQVCLSSEPVPGFVPATETDREYLGGYINFTVRAGDCELRAHVSADTAPARSKQMWISIPQHAPVFLGLVTEN